MMIFRPMLVCASPPRKAGQSPARQVSTGGRDTGVNECTRENPEATPMSRKRRSILAGQNHAAAFRVATSTRKRCLWRPLGRRVKSGEFQHNAFSCAHGACHYGRGGCKTGRGARRDPGVLLRPICQEVVSNQICSYISLSYPHGRLLAQTLR